MIERMLDFPAVYKHFKGHYYLVKGIALDTETGKPSVVYTACYAPFQTFVRPLEMFLSEVDAEKYPRAEQVYRFELTHLTEKQAKKLEEKDNNHHLRSIDKIRNFFHRSNHEIEARRKE